MYGFLDNIARVNLTTRTYTVEHWGERFWREYLGGDNIVACVLQQEIPAGIDPLGPDNKIVIATSILTGTPIAGSSRFSVGAKSPLTDGFGASQAGGFFGPELKFAGFDVMIIEGRSETPCYLYVHDGVIEFRDASAAWGLETAEAEDIFRSETSERAKILQMGIAGENLVKFAAVTTSLKHWCGRCGLGAVFGSKKLRAVVASGSNRSLKMAKPDKVKEYVQWFARTIQSHEGIQFKGEYGTAGGSDSMDAAGMLPTRNFNSGTFEHARDIGGIQMHDELLKQREGCYACPIRCKRVVGYRGSDMDIKEIYGGPEFETTGTMGSNCGIKSLKHLCKANELCGRYGLDTISTGDTIAFAMECYDKGLLTKEGLRRLST